MESVKSFIEACILVTDENKISVGNYSPEKMHNPEKCISSIEIEQSEEYSRAFLTIDFSLTKTLYKLAPVIIYIILYTVTSAPIT